jgi:hypothetical protein
MLVRGVALVMKATILADDNPVVVGRVFHRDPPSAPKTWRKIFVQYVPLKPVGGKKIVRW